MSNEVLGKKKEEFLIETKPILKEEPNKGKLWFRNLIIISICLIVTIVFSLFFFDFKKSDKFGMIIVKEDEFRKPLADIRNYRVVRFENGLDAILISDSKATKSSASLSIGVGSFMDDMQVQGLAHFCEHMLFLGSKSFPKVGEFEDWIVANSGFSNAFTEAERTTFFFEVDNKGFNKTLLMFSRMFAEPNFNATYVNKEIDAVNSEHEKNWNSDVWRRRQLLRSLGNSKHPHFKFATGNNETLRSVSSEKLNDILHNFYDKYYKGFNMKLAIVSNFTLDELQEKANEYFSDIRSEENTKILDKINLKNKNENNLFGNLETNELAYRKEDLGKIIYFKKVSVGSSLDIIFSIDPLNKFYKVKPLDYIDYLLKYSGKKSLLNILRKRKLANKIDSGLAANHKTFAMYQVSFELTTEGFKDVNLVIRLIFNYLNLIKTQPISSQIYDEIKRIGDVNFKFLDKNEDYSNFLSGLSTSMFEYDYQDLLYGDFTHSIFDRTMIQNLMNSLRSENAIIFLGSDFNITANSTSANFFVGKEFKYEKWYNTEYIEAYMNEDFIKNLNNYPVNFENSEKIDPKKSFKLRSKNNFITDSNDLVKDCRESGEKCDLDEIDNSNLDLTPINISDEKNLKIFYKIDRTFKIPKMNTYIKIFSNEFKTSPKDYLYLILISNYLEYNLSTSLSEPMETGNPINLEISNEGLVILINSYTDIAEKIVKIILTELFKFNPDSVIFEEIIEITQKRLNDEKTIKPFQKNMKKYFNKIVKYNYFIYPELLEEIKKEKLSFHNFVMAYEKLKSNLVMNLFFFGSIDKDDLDKIIETVKFYMPKINKSEKSLKSEANSIMAIQNAIHIHRRIDSPITFQVKNDVDNEVNHAVTVLYQVGPRDLKKSLYLSAMDKCLGQVFFYNLRTVQQLGYIVHAGYTFLDSIMYYRIIVQGSKKNPSEIEKSIYEVFYKAQDKISECEGEKFEEAKLAIKDRLNRKDDNLKERSNKIWNEISEHTYDFNRRNELLKLIDKINHETLKSFFNNMFFENPAKLTIFNYSSNTEIELKNKTEAYSLNDKVNVTYTHDFSVLSKQDFIYAYRNIKFGNNRKIFKLRKARKSRSSSGSNFRFSSKNKLKRDLNS